MNDLLNQLALKLGLNMGQENFAGKAMEQMMLQLQHPGPKAPAVGDRVWLDKNANGIQDAGERGVSAVRVELHQVTPMDYLIPGQTEAPIHDRIVAKTTTDQHGNYMFEDVRPSQMTMGGMTRYYVKFNAPDGYGFTRTNATNERMDSDADSTGKTDTFLLKEGVINAGYDAGLVQQKSDNASVGDKVWLDSNANGLQEDNEAGAADVKVTLYRDLNPYSEDGGPVIMIYIEPEKVDSVMTDAEGNYQFDNLSQGRYFIEVEKPEGYDFTRQDAGDHLRFFHSITGDDIDSDVLELNGRSETFNLGVGEALNSMDAGLVKPEAAATGSVGDRVWHDQNINGLQDAGEPGYAGMKVRLYQASENMQNKQDPVAETITDKKGNYRFDDVAAGDYYVQFVANFPSNGRASFQFTRAGAGDDDSKDSDVTGFNGRSNVFSVKAGEAVTNLDAGVMHSEVAPALTGSVGDKVWLDSNANGIQDAGEPGMAGVRVELHENRLAFAHAGSGDAASNTVNDDVYRSPLVTQTDAQGNYQFDNVPAGAYYARFFKPEGYAFTQRNVGDNDAKDSDASNMIGVTDNISVTPGSRISHVDAGLVKKMDESKASVGDKIWHDLDRNGFQEADETGLSGVTVHLYRDFSKDDNYVPHGFVPPSVKVATTTTDAAGQYDFAELAAGHYYIQVDAPEDYVFTRKDAQLMSPDTSGLDVIDSDVNQDGRSATFTLNAGEKLDHVDAGVIFKGAPDAASIGDRVWWDKNGNGLQDSNEPGMEGVKVSWNRQLDDMIFIGDSVVTDKNGHYQFNDLEPGGRYRIQVEAPEGYQFTEKGAGVMMTTGPKVTMGVDSMDSDVNERGYSDSFPLIAGQNKDSVDAGLVKIADQGAQIGDYVWFDKNANGIQDAGESGAAGVTVELRQYVRAMYSLVGDADRDDPGFTNTVIAKAMTDAEGKFSFSDIAPSLKATDNGSMLDSGYYLKFNAPDGYTFTQPLRGGDKALDSSVDGKGRTSGFYPKAGDVDLSLDAGLVKLPGDTSAWVGDRIWLDGNGNGRQDAGEKGLEGVKVMLEPAMNIFVFGDDFSGGESVMQYIHKPLTAITDENGKYQFIDVKPGKYQIRVDLPKGYAFTKHNAAADHLDSDIPNGEDKANRSHSFSVKAGDHISHIDAGLVKKTDTAQGVIGDRIWLDANGDGLQLGDNQGMADVKVTLYRDNNRVAEPGEMVPAIYALPTKLATTMTDAQGNYQFDHLPAGRYFIQVEAPKGYEFTKRDAGNVMRFADGMNPDELDSDVATNGRSHVFTLGEGQQLSSIDAGLTSMKPLATGSIGDRVWVDDRFLNGRQDPGERGAKGIKVELYKHVEMALHENTDGIVTQAMSTPVAVTMTDGLGRYNFDGLEAGMYQLQFHIPQVNSYPYGGHFTKQDVGRDGRDSDVDMLGRTEPFMLHAGQQLTSVDAGIVPRVMAPSSRFTLKTQGDDLVADSTEGVTAAQTMQPEVIESILAGDMSLLPELGSINPPMLPAIDQLLANDSSLDQLLGTVASEAVLPTIEALDVEPAPAMDLQKLFAMFEPNHEM